MATALLIVDVQHYFMQDAPADLPVKITGHYQATSYDTVAFTVFRNHPKSNFIESLKWDKCGEEKDTVLPTAFKDMQQADNVFERAAYSAFKTTELDTFLKQRNIERLVLCGIDTDACVLATAFEAFDLGYHVKVDFDLTYSSGDLEHSARNIIRRSILSRD